MAKYIYPVLILSLLLLSSGFLGAALAQTTPSPALLVGEKDGARLAIVDPVSLEIVARVSANPNPHEVATDGKFAYISNSGAHAITVIDLEAGEQVEGIDLTPLSSVHGLWVADEKLYFANESSRTIGRYDPNTREIDWVLGTGEIRTHMLRVSDDATTIFTTNMVPGTASIIERRADDGDWDISVIPTGPRAEGLDLSPDGREFWVTNVEDSTISVIEIESRRVTGTIELPTTFSNRLIFTPDGKYVVVADLRGNEVLVIDSETHKEVKRIDVGGGSEGMLVTPDNSRLFVAVSTIGKVAVIDLETLTVTATIDGFRNPDGMAWVTTL